jgi:hypothetical protein
LLTLTGHKLEEYNITKDTVVNLCRAPPIEIVVKYLDITKGTTFTNDETEIIQVATYKMNPGDTVQDLMDVIHENRDVAPQYQAIAYGGKRIGVTKGMLLVIPGLLTDDSRSP